MARAFNISAFLKLSTTDFSTKLEGARKNVGRFAKSTEKTFKGIGNGLDGAGKRLLAFGAIPLAGIGVGIKMVTDFASSLQDLKDQLGVSTQFLSEFKFVGEQSGVSLEDIGNAIQKMTINLGKASLGGAQAKNALKQLGLTVEDVKTLSPEKQFELITTRLGDLKDATVRASVGQALLGKSSSSLLRFINLGSKAMNDMRQQARDLGLTLGDDEVQKIDDFGDSLGNLKSTALALGVSFVRGLIPQLTDLVAKAKSIVITIAKWRNEHKELAESIFTTGIAVAGLSVLLGSGLIVVGQFALAISSTAGAIRGFIKLMTVANITALAWVVTAGLLVTAGVLVSDSLGLTNTGLLDYIRNSEIVRKVTDGLFIGLTTGWFNVRDAVIGVWDFLGTFIKNSLLGISASIQGGLAGIIGQLNDLVGSDKLKKLQESLNANVAGANNAIAQNNTARQARTQARRDETDKDIQANFDSSIFGAEGRAEFDRIKASQAKPDTAPAETAKEDPAKDMVKEQSKTNELLGKLLRQQLGSNKSSVPVF